jgi:hypothetical protein
VGDIIILRTSTPLECLRRIRRRTYLHRSDDAKIADFEVSD